jgi:hypothetical protein
MDATDTLTVTLTAAEWNQVMGLMAEGPWRIVNPLMLKIHQQATGQEPSAPNGGTTAFTSYQPTAA